MHRLAKLDQRHIWHPFTQMQDWLRHKPIVIMSGCGAVLRDVHGREYLDANSSIWTNLHGHNHPKINNAIQRLELDGRAQGIADGDFYQVNYTTRLRAPFRGDGLAFFDALVELLTGGGRKQ